MKIKLLFCICMILGTSNGLFAQNTWTMTHSYHYDDTTGVLTNIMTQINYTSGGMNGYTWTIYLVNASTQTHYTLGAINEGGIGAGNTGNINQKAAYINLNSVKGLPFGSYILMVNATIVSGDLALNDPSDYIVYSGSSGIKAENKFIDNAISIYPNPVKSISNMSFGLSTKSLVTFSIFDVNGKLISNPVEVKVPAGEHIIPFDMSACKPGIYYYRLSADDQVKSGTLVKE